MIQLFLRQQSMACANGENGLGSASPEKINLTEASMLPILLINFLHRGIPFERPTPLERPCDYVNLNLNIMNATLDERPPLLEGHISGAKGVASQEGFYFHYYQVLPIACAICCHEGSVIDTLLHSNSDLILNQSEFTVVCGN